MGVKGVWREWVDGEGRGCGCGRGRAEDVGRGFVRTEAMDGGIDMVVWACRGL